MSKELYNVICLKVENRYEKGYTIEYSLLIYIHSKEQRSNSGFK